MPGVVRWAGMGVALTEADVRATGESIARALRADAGSLLAFLPGAAEIRRTQAQLEGRVDPSTDVVALYGLCAYGSRENLAV